MITTQERREYSRKIHDQKRGNYLCDDGRWYPVCFDGDTATITIHKIFQKADIADRDYGVIVDRDVYDRLKGEGRRLFVKPYIGGKWHRHDNVVRVMVNMTEEVPDNSWALAWYVLGHRSEKGVLADHINGDDLDNRKANLRWATHEQNMQNRQGWNKYSEHAGVSFNKKKQKWIAQVIASFDTKEEAETFSLMIHNAAFGEYARKGISAGKPIEKPEQRAIPIVMPKANQASKKKPKHSAYWYTCLHQPIRFDNPKTTESLFENLALRK